MIPTAGTYVVRYWDAQKRLRAIEIYDSPVDCPWSKKLLVRLPDLPELIHELKELEKELTK